MHLRFDPSRIFRYAYVNSRVKGLLSSLLTTREYERMLDAGFEGAYSILDETAYRGEIATIPMGGFDLLAFEDNAISSFFHTIETLKKESPREAKPLIGEISKRFEAAALKSLLRARNAGLDLDHAIMHISPAGRFDRELCISLYERSSSVEEMIELVQRTEYGRALKDAFPDFEARGSTIPLEVALDRYVYSRIWEAVKLIGGLGEKIAQNLIGAEIDALNIRNIPRCVAMGLSTIETRSYVIPIYFHLTEERVERAIGTSDVEECLEALQVRPYETAIENGLESYRATKSTLGLELSLDRLLLELNRQSLVSNPSLFHIGPILVYINLKWMEIRNLRILLTGLRENVPREKIEALLIRKIAVE